MCQGLFLIHTVFFTVIALEVNEAPVSLTVALLPSCLSVSVLEIWNLFLLNADKIVGKMRKDRGTTNM